MMKVAFGTVKLYIGIVYTPYTLSGFCFYRFHYKKEQEEEAKKKKAVLGFGLQFFFSLATALAYHCALMNN